MEVSIKKATKEDYPAIIKLVQDLATFEKNGDKITNTAELMEQEEEYFGSYIAVDENNKILGMAIYFFAYYTWVGKSLYLDDLFVIEEYRGHKIGTKLLNKIFEVAKEENCKRLRWQVIHWNKKAIEFYKKAGASIDNEWLNCEFDKEGIVNFKL